MVLQMTRKRFYVDLCSAYRIRIKAEGDLDDFHNDDLVRLSLRLAGVFVPGYPDLS